MSSETVRTTSIELLIFSLGNNTFWMRKGRLSRLSMIRRMWVFLLLKTEQTIWFLFVPWHLRVTSQLDEWWVSHLERWVSSVFLFWDQSPVCSQDLLIMEMQAFCLPLGWEAEKSKNQSSHFADEDLRPREFRPHVQGLRASQWPAQDHIMVSQLTQSSAISTLVAMAKFSFCSLER